MIIKWIECDLNCSTCNGPTSENCLSCHEPKYLLEGKCVDSCPLGYHHVNITKSCQSKEVKQIIYNGNDLTKNEKIGCDSSCLECSGGGNNNCLKCNNALYFYFGQCLIECPTGYYQDTSSFQCQNCPQTCLHCSSGIYFILFIFIFVYCDNKNK